MTPSGTISTSAKWRAQSVSEKQELIKKMLEMQKEFIAYEHKNGVEPREYWAAEEGHPLGSYKEEYAELATKVVDLAHAEKGSKR